MHVKCSSVYILTKIDERHQAPGGYHKTLYILTKPDEPILAQTTVFSQLVLAMLTVDHTFIIVIPYTSLHCSENLAVRILPHVKHACNNVLFFTLKHIIQRPL